MMFSVDKRIESSSFFLGDWPLSRVFLKDEACFPWLILVPRKDNIQELYQLTLAERLLFMEEIHHLSLLVKEYFKPDKINIAALGNIVSQCHLHVVGRSIKDELWPQGVWQSSWTAMPYEEKERATLVPALRSLVREKSLLFETASLLST